MRVDHDAILSWYAAVRRDLPWRRSRDPYRILVSEVMLQQTQVARVVPYYEAFLERFPDEVALGDAPTADVLRLWSGLGYNRRALALQACARAVAREGWPTDAAGLRALPGIGPYTAAAVASFAFGEQVAAVDTNVKRVIERIDRQHRTTTPLAARAAELLPDRRAADWNQAMMELGATVCTARAPSCGECPVASCRSRGRPLVPPPSLSPASSSSSRRSRPAQRFEETDRFVRGRIVAALAAGEGLPTGIDDDRVERALVGLERDGLVVRDGTAVRLPQIDRAVVGLERDGLVVRDGTAVRLPQIDRAVPSSHRHVLAAIRPPDAHRHVGVSTVAAESWPVRGTDADAPASLAAGRLAGGWPRVQSSGSPRLRSIPLGPAVSHPRRR